ncbi:LOW QUALITY PROTEIN: neuropeptide B [Rhynchonycteris naso]
MGTHPSSRQYKQAAWPSSLVGRSAGLLSSFCESPYVQRSKAPVGTGTSGRPGTFAELCPSLPSSTICIKDSTPNLQSYERLLDDWATFQCKADIFLSLHAADCRSA